MIVGSIPRNSPRPPHTPHNTLLSSDLYNFLFILYPSSALPSYRKLLYVSCAFLIYSGESEFTVLPCRSIAILRFQKIPACENPVLAHLPANNLHNESVRHYRLHTLCKSYRQFLYRQFAESDHQFLPAVLTAERNRFSSNSFQ